MTKDTFPQFPDCACVGDSIQWTKDGFDFVARIAQDYDTEPMDFDCYDIKDIERWNRDEWFYCGVVLSVSLKGIELDHHAASLWGVECNFSDTANAYLSEVAQELEAEALTVARSELERIKTLLKN